MSTPQIIAIEIPIGSFNVQIHNGKIRYKNNKKQIDLTGQIKQKVQGFYETEPQHDIEKYVILGLLSKLKDNYTASSVRLSLIKQNANLNENDYVVCVTSEFAIKREESHVMNSLNAYFHAKVLCQYADPIMVDRHSFKNKKFIDLIANARKHARILIQEIEKTYIESGISLETIEQENNIIYEIMEQTEMLTEKIEVKFNKQ